MSKDSLLEVVMTVVDAQPTIDEHNKELSALLMQLEAPKATGRLTLMRRMSMLHKLVQDLGGKPSVPEYKFKLFLTLQK